MDGTSSNNSERITTILSIDGGGIRGLVPLAIIASLEEKLQAIEVENGGEKSDVRIADYFDVIAGTSTGGLIAAMLVVPDNSNIPKNTAEGIKDFYYKNGADIFSPADRGCLCDGVLWALGPLGDLIRARRVGPKYDGKDLRKIIRDQMKDLTLDRKRNTLLSDLVMPTFDVRRLEPVVFTTFPPHDCLDDKKDDEVDPQKKQEKVEVKPLLADVCIATSAAPTYFPPHKFKAKYNDDSDRVEFHLVDGGLAANNPTMVAIARVAREAALGNGSFDYKKCLVLSIGTGYAKERNRYNEKECEMWSRLDWVSKDGRTPIIDMLGHANEFLVNLNVAILFHSHGVPKNYLRIQARDGAIPGPQKPMDEVTDMDGLYNIGKELLHMPLARMEMTTGKYRYVYAEATNTKIEGDPKTAAAGTPRTIDNPHKTGENDKYLLFKNSNDNELKDFAKKLWNERRKRQRKLQGSEIQQGCREIRGSGEIGNGFGLEQGDEDGEIGEIGEGFCNEEK